MKKKILSKFDFGARIRRPTPEGRPNSTEAAWRLDLEAMSQDQLVNACVSAAWEIKALNGDIDRLWTQYCETKKLRANAAIARLAKSDKAAAKAEFKKRWLVFRSEGTPSRGAKTRWMQETWNYFDMILEYRTIAKWVGQFEKEAEMLVSDSEPQDISVTRDEERWAARPEIHHLLDYVPKGFFKYGPV